jgi:hypothetical protein
MFSGGRVDVAVAVVLLFSFAQSRFIKELSEVDRDAGWDTAGDTRKDIVLRSLYIDSRNEAERAGTAGSPYSHKHARQLKITPGCAGTVYIHTLWLPFQM